jgi:diguanylate cyclase (GGDEF)-like protein/PAS domain S-box-containing protein
MQSRESDEHQERRSLVYAAFDVVSDAVIIADARGVICEINGPGAAMFGWDRGDIVGRSMALLMTGRGADTRGGSAEEAVVAAMRRATGVGRQATGHRRDGSSFPVQVSVSEFDLDGAAMYVAVCRDLAERDRLLDEKAYLAEHDAMTGCLNRHHFLEQLHERLAVAASRGTKVAVLYVDLDDFKAVNDRYGHAVGDEILVRVVERCWSVLRPDDLIGRLGGDEFAVAVSLTHLGAEPEIARELANRLSEMISEPIDVNGTRFQIAASIGIALYPDMASSREEILHKADLAMYAAKAGARAVEEFSPQLGGVLDAPAPDGAARLWPRLAPRRERPASGDPGVSVERAMHETVTRKESTRQWRSLAGQHPATKAG